MRNSILILRSILDQFLISADVPAESLKREADTFLNDSPETQQHALREEVSQLSVKSARTQYVAELQEVLTQIADDVTLGTGKLSSALKSYPDLQSLAARCVEHLFYLYQHYSRFFNLQAVLPVSWMTGSYQVRLAQFAQTVSSLGQLGVENELLQLLQNFVSEDEQHTSSRVKTWWQLGYIQHLEKQIEYFARRPAGENVTLELIRLLVMEDFNSIQVYAYFLKYIESVTIGMSTINEQQQEFLFLQKVFRQVRVDGRYSFDPAVQQLKVTVVNGLTAELEYLAQKEKLMLREVRVSETASISRFYFEVMVTLAELMFFFRVMLDVGFIHTKFNSHLYDFVANHIRTQRAENLSKKSMRNHMSNKPYPDRVVHNTRDWLAKMIKHIDTYYKA